MNLGRFCLPARTLLRSRARGVTRAALVKSTHDYRIPVKYAGLHFRCRGAVSVLRHQSFTGFRGVPKVGLAVLEGQSWLRIQ